MTQHDPRSWHKSNFLFLKKRLNVQNTRHPPHPPTSDNIIFAYSPHSLALFIHKKFNVTSKTILFLITLWLACKQCFFLTSSNEMNWWFFYLTFSCKDIGSQLMPLNIQASSLKFAPSLVNIKLSSCFVSIRIAVDLYHALLMMRHHMDSC